MQRPHAVLFDYGHTLIYESDADTLAGYAAVLRHATENPRGLDAQAVWDAQRVLYARLMRPVRAHDLELPNLSLWRLLFSRLQLSFDLPLETLETVYWDAACPPHPMPGVCGMLETLSELGIASAVVSNLTFSAATLQKRIERILPGHAFSAVLTSSDYGVRKPDRLLLEAALAQLDCAPHQAWFCGDNTQADLWGAYRAGLFPVWMQSDLPRAYRRMEEECDVPFVHLHIASWDVFADFVRRTRV